MHVTVTGYSAENAWSESPSSIEDLDPLWDGGIRWINLSGLEDHKTINQIAEIFHIHPLTVEDILLTGQRPKVEEFDNYLFFTLKAIAIRQGELVIDQLSLIIQGNTVLSFQENSTDVFEGIRKRILSGGKIRKMGADYLVYTLLDTAVDEYFTVLDQAGGDIEEFEQRAMDENDKDFLADLQEAKRKLLRIRRTVWPLRESFTVFFRMESPLIGEDLLPFFKDLQGNIVQAGETIETYRELLAGVMEVNLSILSNRMNNVMKTLTIVSTLFIPLTFIVGVYGMNFAHMPELGHPYGYPITLGAMGLIALGMAIFFKRRRWF